MKIKKLDRRMNGYGYYSHVVEFPGYVVTALKDMHPVRVWLWENFGPSMELHGARKDANIKWAWDTEHNHCRLYLKEEALTMFKLKWS